MRKIVWFAVLVGMVGVLALGVVLLWQVSADGSLASSEQSRKEMPWTGLASPVSMEDAADRGLARAQLWAGDAFLVWVKGSWQPSGDWLQATYPPIAWSFYFYSSGKEALASATVRGDELFWAPPVASPTAYEALEPFPPSYGIDVAWLDFRAAGGEAFLLDHPDATVQYRLKNEAGKLTWVIFALDEMANFEVKVDALSGLVLTANH